MKTNVKGIEIPAVIIAGTGYADARAVLEALGVPVRQGRWGRLQIGLRGCAQALGLPGVYMPTEETFYLGARPLPLLPAGPVGTDVQPWIPVNAPIAGGPGDRRPDLLTHIIQQFRVATNPRHAPRDGNTYCNIFAWDVTRALGAEIPHWVTGDGTPAAPGVPGAWEMDANATIQWLRQRGPDFNWRPTSATGALAAANAGKPAMTSWLNPGGIGHVAIVRPGQVDPQRGLPIAQAGAVNFDDGYLVDGFGRYADQVEFYVHD